MSRATRVEPPSRTVIRPVDVSLPSRWSGASEQTIVAERFVTVHRPALGTMSAMSVEIVTIALRRGIAAVDD